MTISQLTKDSIFLFSINVRFFSPYTVLILSLFMTSSLLFPQDEIRNSTIDVHIKINEKGYFDVHEILTVDFDEIDDDRKIIGPYYYRTTNRKSDSKEIKGRFYISDVQVEGGTYKKSGKTEMDKKGFFIIDFFEKKEELKGVVTYDIRYRVKNAMKRMDDEVIIYWPLFDGLTFRNVIFDEVQFNIDLPQTISASESKFSLLKNNFRTNSGLVSLDESSINTDEHHFNGKFSPELEDGMRIYDVYGKLVLPGEKINKTTYLPPFWPRFYWTILIGIFVLYFLGVRIKNWISNYDPQKVIPVISYYPPNDIDPVMAGLLIDENLDHRDLTALLAKWSYEKVIEIQEPKGSLDSEDYIVTKLKELPTEAEDYEKLFFRVFFLNAKDGKVNLDEIRGEAFRKFHAKASKKMIESAAEYYDLEHWREQRERGLMYDTIILSPGLGILAIMVIISLGLERFEGPIILFVILVIALAIGSGARQKKTEIGRQTLAELKGFKIFIETAEVNMINKLMEEDPNYYRKTTSYAAAFGLLKEWNNKFKFLSKDPN